MTLQEQIYKIIQDKLIECKYDIQEAADELGIGRSTIYRHVQAKKIFLDYSLKPEKQKKDGNSNDAAGDSN